MNPAGELLSDEDWEGVPFDRREAFVYLEGRARSKMRAAVAMLDREDSPIDWQLDYVNTVVSLAHSYEIEDLAGLVLPNTIDFDDSSYRYYSQQISSAVTKIRAADRMAAHASTVALTQADKARVEKKLSELRELIEGSELDDGRKARLLARLTDFERELSRQRPDVRKLLLFGVLIAGWSNDVVEFPSTIRTAYEQALAIVAKAKAAEEDSQVPLQLPSPPKMLAAPPASKRRGFDPNLRRESFPADLDDEIPF